MQGHRLLTGLSECRRSLLQSNNDAINIGTFVASNDPTGTQNAYNAAVQDGRLRQQLQGIGLDLVGNPVVTVSPGFQMHSLEACKHSCIMHLSLSAQ